MKRAFARIWLISIGLTLVVFASLLLYNIVCAALKGDDFAQCICGAFGLVVFLFVSLWAIGAAQ
jgi:hypothetical protein